MTNSKTIEGKLNPYYKYESLGGILTLEVGKEKIEGVIDEEIYRVFEKNYESRLGRQREVIIEMMMGNDLRGNDIGYSYTRIIFLN